MEHTFACNCLGNFEVGQYFCHLSLCIPSTRLSCPFCGKASLCLILRPGSIGCVAYSSLTSPCRVFHIPILVVAYRLSPNAYCLLPIAYCLLPIAYCLLPIAYCLSLPLLRLSPRPSLIPLLSCCQLRVLVPHHCPSVSAPVPAYCLRVRLLLHSFVNMSPMLLHRLSMPAAVDSHLYALSYIYGSWFMPCLFRSASTPCSIHL